MTNATTEKKIFTPTAEQQRIIDALKDAQANSRNAKGDAKGDNEFAKDLSVKGSAWNMIKSGKYWTLNGGLSEQTGNELLAKLERDLSKLQRKNAAAARLGTQCFVELPDFSAVFSAVDECSAKPLSDSNRYIAYLAPTGGGKSALLGELNRRFDAEIVEFRPSWKGSGYDATAGFASEIGVRGLVHGKGTTYVEGLIVEELSKRNAVIGIDEGGFVNRQILNLLKLVMNKTRTVIVHTCIPEDYENITKYYSEEFKQIRRRTHLLVRGGTINPDGMKKMLAPLQLNGLASQAAPVIARAANSFGGYDFASRIIKRLQDNPPSDIEDIESEIAKEKKCYGA